ncbi:hypothetical protein FQA47_003964 [Oryzias melastigma]|uniref:Secreted protein n=1 Tax=Oryzias melastigma TaxID=30732 RepID=A0A834F6B4_ORYME|nr:hypothetical protein FQA47_003964 [Oryzias melastigma]
MSFWRRVRLWMTACAPVDARFLTYADSRSSDIKRAEERRRRLFPLALDCDAPAPGTPVSHEPRGRRPGDTLGGWLRGVVGNRRAARLKMNGSESFGILAK